jgi:hypothetical protein
LQIFRILGRGHESSLYEFVYSHTIHKLVDSGKNIMRCSGLHGDMQSLRIKNRRGNTRVTPHETPFLDYIGDADFPAMQIKHEWFNKN